MGAPFWSKEEKVYFFDVILPMSKYAGGNYSNPQGMDFAELAAIMQEELDRKGTSRRQYTGDMLFQHYYQKCSARSYTRGERDHVATGNSTVQPSSHSMDPPPRPTSARRPASKRCSMNITYGHASTQTYVTIEAGSKSELALQDFPHYPGPPAALYNTTAHSSNLVQPVAASTKKRKYQATVEHIDDDDDDDDDYFPLRDESLEAAMQPVVRKSATHVRDNVPDHETRNGDGTFKSMDEILKLLNTQTSDSERRRTAELQNPWAQSFGTRPQTASGKAHGFTSPRSDTRSEGTSSIAYKTYTPSLSLDRLSLVSDTSRPSRYRRSMAKSLLKESFCAHSRALDKDESSHGAFQAARSPQRDISRRSNSEEFDTRATSSIIRSPRVGSPRAEYRESPRSSEFTHSPQCESSQASLCKEQSQTSCITRSPFRLSTSNPNSSLRYNQDESWHPFGRRGSLLDPNHYQGFESRKQDSDNDQPIRRSVSESSRFSNSYELRTDYTPIHITTEPNESIIGGRTPLPSFRKRSKQQHSASFPSTQPQDAIQFSRPTKHRVNFNPFT